MRSWWVYLITLYLSLPAWARLGGGSRYSSSRSSSSGGSRSYSSGGSWTSSGSSGSSWSRSHRSSSSGGGDVEIGFLFKLAFIAFLLFVGALLLSYLYSTLKDKINRKGFWAFGLVWLYFSFFHYQLLGFLVVPALLLAGKFGVINYENIDRMVTGMFDTLTEGLKTNANFSLNSSGLPIYTRPVYAEVLSDDPNFSVPIFREFAVLLYAQALLESPENRYSSSVPYMSLAARKKLLERVTQIDKVRDVVVGSVRMAGVSRQGDSLLVRMEFDANYTVEKDGSVQSYMALEDWFFQRKLGVLSKAPESVLALKCPSCGYGGDFGSEGVCPQCRTNNSKGEYSWRVSQIVVKSLETFNPNEVEQGEEIGTDYPTITHQDLAVREEQFMVRHPDFRWPEFFERATEIFLKLQKAWSERDARECRPHETDTMYRTHRYWIEEYTRLGKINRLSDVSVQGWELSNIVTDAFYETVVARVRASMTDVTTDESGRVLSGDPRRPREFTEYWTFIRKIGFQKGKGDSIHSCPSCGGPLDRVSQTGHCEYCDSLITLGDFDWILTNIEQDEVYLPW